MCKVQGVRRVGVPSSEQHKYAVSPLSRLSFLKEGILSRTAAEHARPTYDFTQLTQPSIDNRLLSTEHWPGDHH